MDGSVALLDARRGEVLAAARAHTKYCVRVRWLPGGAGFVSAGREGALACWACATGAPACPAAAPGLCWRRLRQRALVGCSSAWLRLRQTCAPGYPSRPWTLEVRRRLAATAEDEGSAGAEALRQTCAEPYAAAVQDVELLAGGGTAVVALRDTCRLRLFDVAAGAGERPGQPEPPGRRACGLRGRAAGAVARRRPARGVHRRAAHPGAARRRCARPAARWRRGCAANIGDVCPACVPTAPCCEQPEARGASDSGAPVTAAQAGSRCATSAASQWSPSTSPPRCGMPAASTSWPLRRLGRFSSSMSARARRAPPPRPACPAHWAGIA